MALGLPQMQMGRYSLVETEKLLPCSGNFKNVEETPHIF